MRLFKVKLILIISQLLLTTSILAIQKKGNVMKNHRIRGLKEKNTKKDKKIDGKSKEGKGNEKAKDRKELKIQKKERKKQFIIQLTEGTGDIDRDDGTVSDIYLIARGQSTDNFLVSRTDNNDIDVTFHNGDGINSNSGINRNDNLFDIPKGIKKEKKNKPKKVFVQRYEPTSTFYLTDTAGGSSEGSQTDPIYIVLKDSTAEKTIGCIHGCGENDNFVDSTIFLDSDGDGYSNVNIYVEKAKHQGKYHGKLMSLRDDDPFAISTGTTTTMSSVISNEPNQNVINPDVEINNGANEIGPIENTGMASNVQDYIIDLLNRDDRDTDTNETNLIQEEGTNEDMNPQDTNFVPDTESTETGEVLNVPYFVETNAEQNKEYGGLSSTDFINNCIAISRSIANDEALASHQYEVELKLESDVNYNVTDVYDTIRGYLQEFAAPEIAGCTNPPNGTSIRKVQFGVLSDTPFFMNSIDCITVERSNECEVRIPISIASVGDPPFETPLIISTVLGEYLPKIPRKNGLIDIYSEDSYSEYSEIVRENAKTLTGEKSKLIKGAAVNREQQGKYGKQAKDGKKEQDVKQAKDGRIGQDVEQAVSVKTGRQNKFSAINDSSSNQTNSDSIQAGRVTGIVLSGIAVLVALFLLCCRRRCTKESDPLDVYKASDDDSDGNDDGECTIASSHYGEGPRVYNVQTNDDDTTEVILTSWMKAQEKKRKKEMVLQGDKKIETSSLNREKNYICC